MTTFERGWRRSPDIDATREMRFPSASGQPAPLYVPAGDGGPALPSRAQDASNSAFVRAVPPPWTTKIGPASRDFNVTDFAVALAAVAGQQASSTTLRFQLPTDQVGWLQEATLYIQAPTALARVQYAIRINEGPVSGLVYENLPGVANFEAIDKNDLNVRIPSGGTVDMLFTNLNGLGAFTVGGRLAGWYHPKASELAYWGELP